MFERRGGGGKKRVFWDVTWEDCDAQMLLNRIRVCVVSEKGMAITADGVRWFVLTTSASEPSERRGAWYLSSCSSGNARFLSTTKCYSVIAYFVLSFSYLCWTTPLCAKRFDRRSSSL